jgi:hypothetical protein
MKLLIFQKRCKPVANGNANPHGEANPDLHDIRVYEYTAVRVF